MCLFNGVSWGTYLVLVGAVGCIVKLSLIDKMDVKDRFQSVKLGMTYLEVLSLLGKTNELISEKRLDNGSIKLEYIWYFGWYNQSISRGRNFGYKSSSVDNGNTKGFFNIITKKRVYIKVVFLNGRVLSKKQKGIEYRIY